MRKLVTVLLGLTVLCVKAGTDRDVAAAEALARRVVPEIAASIEFERIDAAGDTFCVTSRDQKVVVRGSSAIAMSVGLNNYLRNVLGVSVPWFADQPMLRPQSAVLPAEPLVGNARVRDRFFLNYCTFGYTMAFWTWHDWEHFIDWMALNGINMPLAMTGQEKIWFETWRRLGLDDDSILRSFTGPSHLPWHWMANVDAFCGPLTDKWLDDNEALQKQILARERELGMKPVLPAFSGHVPGALRTVYPEASILQRESWGGFKGEHRTWFLDPADPLYACIQSTFLAVQDSIYGTDHIYGIDPFNEIDSPDWSEDYLRAAAANICNTLVAADPDARWLQMTWCFYNDPEHWTKPRVKAFLEGVPDDRLLLLDYYLDAQPVWKLTDAYFGKPYILCYLGNFGGNTMIVGNLRDINEKIDDFLNNGGANGSGIGGTLEGLDVNQVVHEFVLAKVWNPGLTPDRWIEIWARTRGADNDPAVLQAWQLLENKVYRSYTKNGQGGLTNVRPSLTKISAGCATAAYDYDNRDLAEALRLLSGVTACADNPAYRFDLMNVRRQFLANDFRRKRDELAAAYCNSNVDSVAMLAAQMDSVMVELDSIMAEWPDFTLRKWISNARSHGRDEAEKSALERDARTLLTTWGYPGCGLTDYANRHWSGLIDTYYRPRWQRFTSALIASLNEGVPFDEDTFRSQMIDFENAWRTPPE